MGWLIGRSLTDMVVKDYFTAHVSPVSVLLPDDGAVFTCASVWLVAIEPGVLGIFLGVGPIPAAFLFSICHSKPDEGIVRL